MLLRNIIWLVIQITCAVNTSASSQTSFSALNLTNNLSAKKANGQSIPINKYVWNVILGKQPDGNLKAANIQKPSCEVLIYPNYPGESCYVKSEGNRDRYTSSCVSSYFYPEYPLFGPGYFAKSVTYGWSYAIPVSKCVTLNGQSFAAMPSYNFTTAPVQDSYIGKKIPLEAINHFTSEVGGLPEIVESLTTEHKNFKIAIPKQFDDDDDEDNYQGAAQLVATVRLVKIEIDRWICASCESGAYGMQCGTPFNSYTVYYVDTRDPIHIEAVNQCLKSDYNAPKSTVYLKFNPDAPTLGPYQLKNSESLPSANQNAIVRTNCKPAILF